MSARNSHSAKAARQAARQGLLLDRDDGATKAGRGYARLFVPFSVDGEAHEKNFAPQVVRF